MAGAEGASWGGGCGKCEDGEFWCFSSRRRGRNIGANTMEVPPLCLGIDKGYPSAGESEDCLFVNVWTPSNATQTSKLPVWLFIQGGGMFSKPRCFLARYPLSLADSTTGYVANTNGNWDGNEVVEKSGHNIVMVNFNYRVGLWGFLASERVRDDGVLNAGLLDQRLLLKWVQTHIASVCSLLFISFYFLFFLFSPFVYSH